MKKSFSFGSLVLALLALPTITLAAQFHAAGEYTLPKGETVQENLYAAGGTVTILGDVEGDVIAAGGTVIISGNIRDDVLVAGGTVMINGQVGGDVRTAGGQVIIDGAVAHDLLASGGSITIGPSAHAMGDTLLSGGQIDVEGNVAHPLQIAGGTIILDGPVNGDVNVKAGNITLGNKTIIKGNFTYDSPNQTTKDSAASITGQTTYHRLETQSWLVGIFSIFWFARLLMALTLGLILFHLFGRQTHAVVRNALSDIGPNLLKGFLVLIAAPIVFVVLFMTIIGIPIGIMGIFAYITFIMFSLMFSGIIFGSVIFKYGSTSNRSKDYTVSWQSVVLGIILLNIIGFVPIIGWLVRAIFFLMALGVLYNMTYQRVKSHFS